MSLLPARLPKRRRRTARVEGVEGFDAELERSGFGEAQIFSEREVEVVNSGAVEDAAFGVAQVVLIESSLEFLRVGVTSSASWGEMLSEARGQPGAYWLLVFPGLAIFVVVASLHVIGETLRDALDPQKAGRPAEGLPRTIDMPPPGDSPAEAKAGTLLSK